MTALATQPVERFLLTGISWTTYEAMLRDLGDRPVRMTYDRGDLEIMSPSPRLERQKRAIGRLIETLTAELNVPIDSLGMTTWRHALKEKGLEPDECYYIANEGRVRGKTSFDLTVDPPPDLAIEVDITRSSIDRMDVYATLGVPEVWRFDGVTLHIHLLQPDGRYIEKGTSLAFPFLPMEQIQSFLDRREQMNETAWIRSFRDWVRQLAPRA